MDEDPYGIPTRLLEIARDPFSRFAVVRTVSGAMSRRDLQYMIARFNEDLEAKTGPHLKT